MSVKPFIRKALSFALILTMVLSLGCTAYAADSNTYGEISSESEQSTGKCDIYATKGASYAVKIPTSLTLNVTGTTGTGNYEVFVKGDIDGDHFVSVEPQSNSVSFSKTTLSSDTTSTTRQGTVTQTVNEVYYNEIAGAYPESGQLSGNVTVTELTTGTWKGQMVFAIKYVVSVPLNATAEMDKAAVKIVAKEAPNVTFARKVTAPSGTTSSVDVSTAKDSSVMAHTLSDGSVVIGADGGVLAPENMSSAFNGFKATNIDCSGLDTKNTTNMNNIFRECYNLTSLNVSNFDTSTVTNMGYMFYNCSNLTSLNVSNFDTSTVTNMGFMFCGCSSLTSLDVSHFDTSIATDMGFMFCGCSSLTSLDVSHFNTRNATTFTAMFSNCSNLTSLDVNNFNTSNARSIDSMFHGCSGLISLDVSSFNTDNVTTMQSMFRNCSGLTSLDVSNFNTSNVGVMTQMFDGCSSLTTLNINGFDVSKIKTDYSNSAFSGNDNVTIYVSDVNMETWVKSTRNFPATATVIVGSPS